MCAMLPHPQEDQVGTGTPVTQLLLRWREGDAQAREQLMELVYGELRRKAAAHLRR